MPTASTCKYATGFWGGKPVRARFADLARALGSLGVWVRMHYVYPYPHVDNVIPLMADGKVLPYLDVPFQHGSPRVFKLMKRPAHAENTLARIRAWRDICPEITLRSTFIVGFPGETEQDFQLLLDWLAEAQLDRVGCFKYSPVEGAAANALPDPVPDDSQAGALGTLHGVVDSRSARRSSRRRSASACGCSSTRLTRTGHTRARVRMRPKSTAPCASIGRASSRPVTGRT